MIFASTHPSHDCEQQSLQSSPHHHHNASDSSAASMTSTSSFVGAVSSSALRLSHFLFHETNQYTDHCVLANDEEQQSAASSGESAASARAVATPSTRGHSFRGEDSGREPVVGGDSTALEPRSILRKETRATRKKSVTFPDVVGASSQQPPCSATQRLENVVEIASFRGKYQLWYTPMELTRTVNQERYLIDHYAKTRPDFKTSIEYLAKLDVLAAAAEESANVHANSRDDDNTAGALSSTTLICQQANTQQQQAQRHIRTLVSCDKVRGLEQRICTKLRKQRKDAIREVLAVQHDLLADQQLGNTSEVKTDEILRQVSCQVSQTSQQLALYLAAIDCLQAHKIHKRSAKKEQLRKQQKVVALKQQQEVQKKIAELQRQQQQERDGIEEHVEVISVAQQQPRTQHRGNQRDHLARHQKRQQRQPVTTYQLKKTPSLLPMDLVVVEQRQDHDEYGGCGVDLGGGGESFEVKARNESPW